MVDIKEVKKLMIDADLKPKDLAALIGVTTSAFHKKLNGKMAFTVRDMDVMITRLDIENPKTIFFKQEVS